MLGNCSTDFPNEFTHKTWDQFDKWFVCKLLETSQVWGTEDRTDNRTRPFLRWWTINTRLDYISILTQKVVNSLIYIWSCTSDISNSICACGLIMVVRAAKCDGHFLAKCRVLHAACLICYLTILGACMTKKIIYLIHIYSGWLRAVLILFANPPKTFQEE